MLVCMGNICRSPLAEVIMSEHARRLGLEEEFVFASRGMMNWNVGCGADPRSMASAAHHGLDLRGHQARQLRLDELDHWDWFVAMDHSNRLDLLAFGVASELVLMMRQFEDGPAGLEVPDPYNDADNGFEKVFAMLEANAGALLNDLLRRDREKRADQSHTV
ncbi:MAG: low molecular weight protein-tyrosine-phosphatase [Mariprofundaceae bacterium]